MRQLLSLIFGRTAKNSYITVGAHIVYGLFTLMFFILASRNLGPEKFGLVSIALAIFAISFDVLSLGTSQALVRFVSVALGKRRYHRALEFASTIFKLRLVESVILIMSALFLGRLIALNIYHQPTLVFPISFTLAAASGILLVDFFISLLQAYERFFRSSLVLLLVAVLKLAFLVPLILTHTATVPLVTAAFVVTPLISSLLGWSLFPKNFFTYPSSKIAINKLIHFSKWMALWGITASLAGRIDILLLGKFTSAYETGIYAAASRLAAGFVIIGSAFASVLTPKISRVIDHPLELKRQFLLVTKVVTVLIATMIGVILLSPWLIPLLFGHQYVESVLVFQSLTLALIFFMANIPSSVTILALGLSKWLGALSLLQLIIVVSLAWILIPSLGAQGAAISLLVSYLVAFGFSTTYAVTKVFS